MKYAIGYQLPDEYDSLTEIAQDYKEHIAEIYFALPGEASGRSVLGATEGLEMSEAVKIFEKEIKDIKNMGINLTLLMNANCYGAESVSVAFRKKTQDTIGRMISEFGLDSVTTTSPFVAMSIKEKFPSMEIRASVNMRVGTVKGMDYLADYFDGYYMQREYNRDFNRLRQLHKWCGDHGKTLHILVNSGCLNFCSYQSYHDNLVAHESEIVANENVKMKYPAPCWDFMSKQKDCTLFLQGSWIRPEDMKNYEPYFKVAKLATRMHANARQVISAYVRGRFRGNMFDLTEPGYSSLFRNNIIDNTLFPDDWFVRTSSCSKNCHECDYCASVAEKVFVDLSDLKRMYTQ
ncbi:MAG: hypothetical protein PHG48_03695 [Eubacteriales bacterium]|nr:hypothetical protein [Eubacteriales bacterium]